MYAMIVTVGKENVCPGDPVVLKYDAEYGRIAAFGVGGESYGFLCDRQPDGCVNGYAMYSRIGDWRVLARAAVVMDGAMLLSFDAPWLSDNVRYVREEREGYGILSYVGA